MMNAPSLTPIAAFERDFARARRRARFGWAVGSALFVAVFLIAA